MSFFYKVEIKKNSKRIKDYEGNIVNKPLTGLNYHFLFIRQMDGQMKNAFALLV